MTYNEWEVIRRGGFMEKMAGREDIEKIYELADVYHCDNIAFEAYSAFVSDKIKFGSWFRC